MLLAKNDDNLIEKNESPQKVTPLSKMRDFFDDQSNFD